MSFFTFQKKIIMNFSIGKIARNIREAIGAIVSGEWPVVDVYQREHSNPYTKNLVIPVTSNTTLSIPLQDLDFFRDKLILGFATRMQSEADDKYSKNGRKLISRAAMNFTFLKLMQNNLVVQESLPLEFLVHDAVTSGVANTYAQVLLEEGLTPSSSCIEFSQPPAGQSGRDIELIVYYVPLAKACYQ